MGYWKNLVSEDFTSGLGVFTAVPDGGAVSADSGELLIQATGGAMRPHAYVTIEDLLKDPTRLLRFQVRYASQALVSGNNDFQWGVAFEFGTNDNQCIDCRKRATDHDDWWFGRRVNGSQTAFWGWSSWRTIPQNLAVYLNPTRHRLYVPETGQVMPPGWIYIAYGVETDGVMLWTNWNAFEHQAFFDGTVRSYEPGALAKFVLFGLSYGSGPSWDARFDNVSVDVTEHPTAFNRVGGQIPEAFVDSQDPGGGLPKTSLGPGSVTYQEKTQHIPGRPSVLGEQHVDPIETLTPPSTAAGDEAALLRQRSGLPRHTPPMGGSNTLHVRGLTQDGHRDAPPRSLRVPISALSDSSDVDQTQDYVWRVNGVVQYRPDTLDPQAHPHFNGYQVRKFFYYRTEGEPWANPTLSGFTGFAKDGFRYTDGVQDAGPVEAPWRQESTFPSGNRSNRGDFPDEVLIAVTDDEVVLFDIDSWPTTSPVVWMRFEIGPSDNYYLMARNAGVIRDVSMANGTLVASSVHTGSENGRLHIADFKADGTNHCAHLIGATNHWYWAGGYDLRNRNESGRWTTSGPSPSLRINPEYCYSVDIFDGGDGKSWVAVAGEDVSPHIIGIEDSVPQYSSVVGGLDRGQDNVGDARRVLFDENGWLWFTYQNQLFRNVLDYQGGIAVAEKSNRRHQNVSLPVGITAIAQSGNYLYLGTERGVYKVDKMSLQAWLAFTIAGGGGGGFGNTPPAGEILVGQNPSIVDMQAITLATANILQVCTEAVTGQLGGVTTIRVTDDLVLESRAYPDIPEDSVFAGGTTLG